MPSTMAALAQSVKRLIPSTMAPTRNTPDAPRAYPERASYGEFLVGIFRNPKGVSALTPSSPSLARAIACEVDATRNGIVIELGPGTGAVTSALLARGLPPQRLLLIEHEPQYVLTLRKLYPQLDIRLGDALHFERYLAPATVIAAVVSGLPLLHLPKEIRRQLIDCALDRQSIGGRFIQLSYGWRPPVPASDKLSIARKAIWSNFPPAHIWTYRKAGP